MAKFYGKIASNSETRQRHMTDYLLALGKFGITTHIGSFLVVLHYQMWSGQVHYVKIPYVTNPNVRIPKLEKILSSRLELKRLYSPSLNLAGEGERLYWHLILT